ncbi:MAG: EamA family transporter RarD [Micrococcales bacterium]
MSDKKLGKGLLYGLGAYLIWGSFPIVISQLSFASPWEVVVWRIVFGFATAVAIITFVRGWSSLLEVLRHRRQTAMIALASVMIMINWQVYVIGVSTHQIVETSLGYFINPLVTILLAVLVLKEKLRPLQWAAVAMGAVAVTVLTFDYGRLPWIAITLAGSFGLYGLIKNRLGGSVSPLNSFALESGMLMPVAVVQGFIVASIAPMAFGVAGVWQTAGLIFFGVMTAVPLILYGAAAKHLPLTWVGFMQYLTPVIQFSLALFLFHEHMPVVRWLGFGLVWLGLGLVSADLLRQNRLRNQNSEK